MTTKMTVEEAMGSASKLAERFHKGHTLGPTDPPSSHEVIVVLFEALQEARQREKNIREDLRFFGFDVGGVHGIDMDVARALVVMEEARNG